MVGAGLNYVNLRPFVGFSNLKPKVIIFDRNEKIYTIVPVCRCDINVL